MPRTSYYIINGITLYRVLASASLLYLIMNGQLSVFKWLLAVSFFTDAIDGFLSRRYGVASVLGARMDSLGDDLTVLMGVIGLMEFRPDFFWQQLPLIIGVSCLFLVQVSMALLRYGRFTAYHTYLAKAAALLQGSFLILCFFLPECPVLLFYAAAGITVLDLVEEIMLVIWLPEWKANVKGLFWIKSNEAAERDNL